jgi:uncharacterized protein (TIGR04551 family)
MELIRNFFLLFTFNFLLLTFNFNLFAQDKNLPAQLTPEKAKESPKEVSDDESDEEEAEETDKQKPSSVNDLLKQDVKKAAEGWDVPAFIKPKEYPYLEHHGYFRFRSDYFYNVHLGTCVINPQGKTVCTSAFKHPLTENYANNSPSTQNKEIVGSQGEKSLASANMRFRYSPTIFVGEGLKINSQLDILDNIVLGSTPDYSPMRADVPLQIFTNSQSPPSSGLNGFKDSIRVKQLYGEIKHPKIGVFRFGRMASQWGLGILANGGQDIDSDWGDYVDRVMFLTKPVTSPFDLYVAAAWDFISEGVVSESPKYAFGQAHDMEQKDDVDQWVFTIFKRPLTDEDKVARRKLLVEEQKPAFDFGFYGVYRKGKLDTSSTSWNNYLKGTYDTSLDWDKFDLINRDGWAFIPDMWLKFEYWPEFRKRLRIELEGVMIYGRLQYAFLDASTTEAERDILQIGAAMEADYSVNGWTFGLDTGFASGDNAEYLAFYGRSNFADPQGEQNKKVTNFKFDPDYHVDLLLFREVIGTITNCFYFKPRVQYDLFDSETDSFGFRFDIEYGQALEPEAYPGNSAFLGIETDFRIFYEEKNRFFAVLEYGMLWPGSAFNLISEFEQAGVDKTAGWAATLQGRLGLMF